MLALASTAAAQNILLVDASGYVSDVADKLQSLGLTVTDFGSGTPDLATLQKYDAVMAFSDSGFMDATALGNVLADYVDGGGRVVQATFAFYDGGFGLGIDGRWGAEGYSPFTYGPQTQGSNEFMGTVYNDAHYTLAGVESFDGGTSSYRNLVGMTPGAERVADWTDGTPLIGEVTEKNGAVVGLNFYPPSSGIREDFWNAGTDGALIMFNALTSRRGCYADFTGDGVLDLFDFLEFVNQFNAGDANADCDGQGGLDLFDFLCYTNEFNAGC
jgi:hypothetical protein